MRLAILGASGHGKVVADTAELVGWDCVVFFDDAWPECQSNGPWAVKGSTSQLLDRLSEFSGVVVAIGINHIRAVKQRQLASAGANLVTLVHPSATISDYASVGIGTVVFANAVVNACAEVGNGCIVNTGAVVEHDCIIGDFVHLSPHSLLAGGVKVGSESWIGACASVKQLVMVGESSVVGMGAVVINNVLHNTTVAGNPARVLTS